MLSTSKSTLRYWKEKKRKYLLLSDLPFDLCIPSFIVCFQISAPLSQSKQETWARQKVEQVEIEIWKGGWWILEFGFA